MIEVVEMFELTGRAPAGADGDRRAARSWTAHDGDDLAALGDRVSGRVPAARTRRAIAAGRALGDARSRQRSATASCCTRRSTAPRRATAGRSAGRG